MSKETITRCEKQKPRFHAFLKVSVLIRVVQTCLLSDSCLFSAVDGKTWNFENLKEC